MYTLNRILIQINEAIEYANSGSLIKKKLAVILLDNLIEIQILKKIEDVLSNDRTTWYETRQFSIKHRKAIKYMEGLLKFSKDQNLITEQERYLLNYSHSIRNEVYHKGEIEDQLLDIAITIYLIFIKDKIKNGRDHRAFM